MNVSSIYIVRLSVSHGIEGGESQLLGELTYSLEATLSRIVRLV